MSKNFISGISFLLFGILLCSFSGYSGDFVAGMVSGIFVFCIGYFANFMVSGD